MLVDEGTAIFPMRALLLEPCCKCIDRKDLMIGILCHPCYKSIVMLLSLGPTKAPFLSYPNSTVTSPEPGPVSPLLHTPTKLPSRSVLDYYPVVRFAEPLPAFASIIPSTHHIYSLIMTIDLDPNTRLKGKLFPR